MRDKIYSEFKNYFRCELLRARDQAGRTQGGDGGTARDESARLRRSGERAILLQHRHAPAFPVPRLPASVRLSRSAVPAYGRRLEGRPITPLPSSPKETLGGQPRTLPIGHGTARTPIKRAPDTRLYLGLANSILFLLILLRKPRVLLKFRPAAAKHIDVDEPLLALVARKPFPVRILPKGPFRPSSSRGCVHTF